MYMDMVELVVPVWTTGCTPQEQAEKVIEEADEVENVVKFDDTRSNYTELLVEECLDTVQAALNLIYKVAPDTNMQAAIMRNFMKNKRRGYIPQS